MLTNKIFNASALYGGAWAQTATQPKEGDGSTDKPYIITKAAELYWFAGLVNGDASVCDYNEETNPTGVKQNTAACATLMNNIVVNMNVLNTKGEPNSDTFTPWTPIGNTWEIEYTGTFDGNGHTVSGLYFNNPNSSYVGLFGNIGENGKISNVGVLDSYFQFDEKGGGVCGKNNGGELQNCSNSSTVIGCGRVGTGGVCGMNHGTVIDCKNTGSVCNGSSNRVGGVCGENYGPIINCFNGGTVSAYQYVGGVCGCNYSTIINCFNGGTVSGDRYVGGVCGYNTKRYEIGTIINCFNKGNVNGDNGVGGVCGYNERTIKNCFNAGYVKANKWVVGGVCGTGGNDDETTNCYYLSGTAEGGIYGQDKKGSAEPMSLEQFKSGEVTWLLNGSQSVAVCWYQKLGENGDEYPVLTQKDGNTVYNKYYICVDKQVYENIFSNTDAHEKYDKHVKATETQSANGLYSYTCQRCQTNLMYIKDFCGIDGNDLELTDDNGKYIAKAVTLKDGEAYNSPVDIEVKDLKYARTYAANKWQPLYVPFAMNVDQWTGKGLTVASINNFHEMKLESGETQVLLEVKKVTSGSLEPNVPYLILCDAEGENLLELGTTTLSKAEEGSIDCHSVTRNYVFQGKYSTMSGFGASETAIYYGVKDGEMVQLEAADEIGPQNWYLTVTNRSNAYDVDTPLTSAAKAISIRVIGDGEATGIEDIHVISDEGENGKQGIFDLQGRQLNAEPTHGIYIKNGKKYVK